MPKPIKVKEKWKGKEWFEIYIPKFLGEMVIGETASADPDALKGRVVETTLFELANDPTRYYIKLFFKISKVEGTKAFTDFFGHECTRDFLARIVHQYTKRIDTNDIVVFENAVKMRVKTVAITNRQVNTEVAKKIRKRISEMLKEFAKNSSDDFVKNFITGKMQQKVRKEISKIYPVRVFEFRKSEVL